MGVYRGGARGVQQRDGGRSEGAEIERQRAPRGAEGHLRTYSCAHGGFFPVWLEGQQVPALTTLDVAAIWPVAGSIELSAGGHNLLDRTIPSSAARPDWSACGRARS